MKNFGFWVKFCIFNFFIVSVIGVMMRYEMAFSLPGFSHKFMQESHSHFAFYGWVSSCIYLFFAQYLKKRRPKTNIFKYHILLICNLIGSYGMLFSFLYGGYYWLSIVFSSVALFSGFAFFVFLILDSKHIKSVEIIWLKAGSFFAVFSSIGIFGLAYFSAHKDTYDVLFRASTYFYLHYQYNGFFLFSCIGLLLVSLKKYHVTLPLKKNQTIFRLLFFGCFFGYGLSVLWVNMPLLLYFFFLFVSIIQLFGGCQLVKCILDNKEKIFPNQSFLSKILFTTFGLAFLLKFLLQTLSTIPVLENFVFNNINIIIGYLHLVLLVGISMFLLWKILDSQHPSIQKKLSAIVFCLIFGVLLNELILMLVGVFSVFYIPFITSAYWLLFASLVIMCSALVLWLRLLRLIEN